MIKKLRNIALSLALSLGMLVPVALPVSTYAQAAIDSDTPKIEENLCAGANLDVNNTTCNDDGGVAVGDKANKFVAKIINIFSWVVGVVAVIMIIIAGFRYITS